MTNVHIFTAFIYRRLRHQLARRLMCGCVTTELWILMHLRPHKPNRRSRIPTTCAILILRYLPVSVTVATPLHFIPSRYVTSHLGQLSLLSLRGG